MAIGMTIDLDRSRWRRTADRYASGRMRVLTAATRMTEEAQDQGVKIAVENIDIHVYHAYSPEFYERSGMLGESPRARHLSTGIASGSVYISRGVLAANPAGHGKPYDRFVEHGVSSPGPGHFARLFWLHTMQDLRRLLFDDLGPAALREVAAGMGPRGA